MAIIEVRSAVKRFGDIVAVAGVDLDVAEGECFGLLGPNGAGKTSLVRMITATSPITSGQITVAGLDVARKPRQVKALIGVVPQETNLDPDFTVLHNLLAFARYFGIEKHEARRRALSYLEMFELDGRLGAKMDELSGGMKRRLLIARGLLNEPRILILDEPTVGLDPQTKHLVWQRLRTLKGQGISQVVTTQNMDEAMRICDRLAIICDGRFIAEGTPQELVRRHGGSQVLEARPREDGREALLEQLKSRSFTWQEVGDTLYVFRPDGKDLDPATESALGIVGRRNPTLEDVFLRLTGRALLE